MTVKRCAVVRDGVVENVVLADDDYIPRLTMQYDAVKVLSDESPVSPGWLYHPDGELVEPVAAEPVEVQQAVSLMQFRRRFTAEELTAFYAAAQEHIPVKVFLDDLNLMANTPFSLTDEVIVSGVQLLVAHDVLSAERATVILQGE